MGRVASAHHHRRRRRRGVDEHDNDNNARNMVPSGVASGMLLILDGNSEYITHAWREKVLPEKKSD